MQSRRRKSRSHSENRRPHGYSGKTSSRFLACALIALVGFAVSCSTNPTKSKKSDTRSERLTKALGQLCLNGSGKGRLETRQERLVFSFVSSLDSKQWHLGLRFPIHGEEDLLMKFPEAGQKGILASGPLTKRFATSMGPRQTRHILAQLGKLVQVLPRAKVSCEASGCSLSAEKNIPITFEEERVAYLDFSNASLAMRLYLPELDQSGAKWSLVWWNPSEKNPIKEQILLFPGDCAR